MQGNNRDSDNIIDIMKKAMEREKAMKEKKDATLQDEITDTEIEKNGDTIDNVAEETNQTNNTSETDVVNEDTANESKIEDEKQEKDSAEDNRDKDDTSDDESTDESQNKGEEGKQGKGKSFFKGPKSKELAAKDQKIEELNDRLIRTMAEFENFRKRSEKEKAQMFDIGAKSVIEKLLPVIDNFERGLNAISEKERESAFAQGIEKIYKQLLTNLEEIGVKPIEAVGKEFDPNLHNAVMHGEDENLGENIISDEFQKGYMYRDTVVRHSMVKVVN